MSVTMRSLAPLSVCVGYLGGEVGGGLLSWVLGSGRDDNSSVHVLTKFSPPSHMGEFYLCMDGLECWALEFSNFSLLQEYIII